MSFISLAVQYALGATCCLGEVVCTEEFLSKLEKELNLKALDRCHVELAALQTLWESGHPDRHGIWLAIEDWIWEEAILMGDCNKFDTAENPQHPIRTFDVAETPRSALLAEHQRLCSAAFNLMQKKNSDYATEADPFRNFRMFGRLGILVRLSDKIARLRTWSEKGAFEVDESVEDTLLDIINYAVLFGSFKE